MLGKFWELTVARNFDDHITAVITFTISCWANAVNSTISYQRGRKITSFLSRNSSFYNFEFLVRRIKELICDHSLQVKKCIFGCCKNAQFHFIRGLETFVIAGQLKK